MVRGTARRDTDDTRTGYGQGGDDYVTRPFSLDELTVRGEAVLRRTGGSALRNRDRAAG